MHFIPHVIYVICFAMYILMVTLFLIKCINFWKHSASGWQYKTCANLQVRAHSFFFI